MKSVLDALKRNKLGWGIFGLFCLAAWVVRAMVLAIFPLSPFGMILGLMILLPGALVAWLVAKASNKVKLIQAQRMEEQFIESEKRRAENEVASWENRLRVSTFNPEHPQPIAEEFEESNTTSKMKV